MTSLTITSDDPDFWPMIEILLRRRAFRAQQNEDPDAAPPTPELAKAQADVRQLLGRIGLEANRFLRGVVLHCRASGKQTFTTRDLARQLSLNERFVERVQLGVTKSANALHIKLWEKRRDATTRRNVFTISRDYVEALRTSL